MSEKRPLADGGETERANNWLGRVWLSVGNRYERYRHLNPADKVAMDWHSWGTILTHWSMLLLLLATAGTGIAKWLGWYGPLSTGIWGGYYVAFGIHMWAGILTLAVTFVIFPYYYVVVDDHRQLLEIADIQVGVDIAESFVGLKKYMPYYHDARRAYDEDKGDWMAHHPMQKTFFWWIAIFMGILALTGFGMYRVIATDPPGWIVTLGFLSGWLALETMKQIHLLLAFVTAAMVLFHIYFAVIPSNWDVLKSMVFGDVEAYIVNGDREQGSGTRDDGDASPSPAAADGGRAVPGSEPTDGEPDGDSLDE